MTTHSRSQTPAVRTFSEFHFWVKYGGVARKQAIPEINGIYNEKIEYLRSLIQASLENEMGE